MGHILSGCMEENKKNRFASADLLSEKLHIVEKQLIFVPAGNTKKEKTIQTEITLTIQLLYHL